MKKLYVLILVPVALTAIALRNNQKPIVAHATEPSKTLYTEVMKETPVVESEATVPVTVPSTPSPQRVEIPTKSVQDRVHELVPDEHDWNCLNDLITNTIGWNMTYDQALARMDYIKTHVWKTYPAAYTAWLSSKEGRPGVPFSWDWE